MNGKSTTTSTKSVASAAEKPAPSVDPTLEETEQILEDYISLLSKNGALIADH